MTLGIAISGYSCLSTIWWQYRKNRENANILEVFFILSHSNKLKYGYLLISSFCFVTARYFLFFSCTKIKILVSHETIFHKYFGHQIIAIPVICTDNFLTIVSIFESLHVNVRLVSQLLILLIPYWYMHLQIFLLKNLKWKLKHCLQIYLNVYMSHRLTTVWSSFTTPLMTWIT